MTSNLRINYNSFKIKKMKIICTETRSKNLDLRDVTMVLNHSYDFKNDGLIIDQEYLVMGIKSHMESSYLYYLIDTQSWHPDWFPSTLFDIIDNTFPPFWHLKLFDDKQQEELRFLMGYEELCGDSNYYYRLVEGEKEASQLYYRKKIELENYYNEYIDGNQFFR